MRRHPLPLALLAVLAAVAAACGGGDDGGGTDAAPAPPREDVVDPGLCPVEALDEADGPVTVTFWHSMTAANKDTLEELTDEYNESQDRVQVRLVFKGSYTDNFEAYRQSVRGGTNTPNLVQLEETTIQQMIDSQSTIPASACVEASGFDLDDILPRVLDQFTVEDTLWPMPFNTSNPILYYNRQLFEEVGLDPDEPPTTLEEVAEMAQEIVDSGKATSAFAVETSAWYIEQLFAKSGEPVVDNDNGRTARATEALFDNELGAEIFGWLDEMLDEGWATSVGRNPEGNETFIAIATRGAAMTFGSSAALGSIYDVLEENPSLGEGVDLGTAPLPGGTEGSVIVGGAALWMADTGEDAQKAATWDYASWLALPEQQSRWHIGTGYIPISEAAADDPDVKKLWRERPGFRTAYDQLVTSEGPAGPVIGAYPEFRDSIVKAIERITQGDDFAEALADADAEATSAIQNYNRRVGE
jgi:sn-glycerol 3-phosphate transport system substrate-binding protein